MKNIQKNRILRAFFISLLILCAVFLRVCLFPFINNDLSIAVIPWFQYLIDNGGLAAMQGLVYGTSYFHPYSYSPPYLYLLTISIPLVKLFSISIVIKIVSVLFDFISAFYAYKIIELKFPAGFQKWIGFFCVIFAPTVIINSAYWGQCDGIYSAFLMAGLYYLLARKYSFSLGLFASALAFKIQAMILAPLYVVLFFRRDIHWRWISLIPTVYLVWMVPAYLSGYPVNGTFLTILAETNAFNTLTMNDPNIHVFFSEQYLNILAPLGLCIGACICGYLIWYAIFTKADLDQGRLLVFIVLIAVVMPFVLPKMHERYFYPAALISILLPFYSPRLRLVPLVLQCTSLLSYTLFLRGYELVPLAVTGCDQWLFDLLAGMGIYS